MGVPMVSGWCGAAGGLLVLLLGSGLCGATTFDAPPAIGDRKVELRWQADADDPIYTGNAVLRIDAYLDTLHASGRPVRMLLPNGTSSEVLSYAEGESRIRRWRSTTGASLGDLALPPGAELRALALHGSDVRLIGGLADGSVLLWRLDRGHGQAEVVAQGVAFRSIHFPPSIRDTSDLRFVSADVDDTVRVWSGPGELRGPGYEMGIPGRLASGLALTSDRSFLAVGTLSGEIRIYDVRTPPNTPLLRLVGHAGAIADLSFARDASKLATIDDRGELRVWGFPSGGLIYSVETVSPPAGAQTVRISLVPPRGRILTVARADGTVEIRDGLTGERFAELDVTGAHGLLSSAAFAADGVHTYIGDEAGGISLVRAGLCRPGEQTPQCFGGYMIWRCPTLDPQDAVLLRVYNYSDSTWTFRGEERAFADPDSVPRRENPPTSGQDEVDDELRISGPHNGIPFYYSITRFDWRYETGGVFQVYPDGSDAIRRGFFRERPEGPPTPIVAQAEARAVAPLLGRVVVVPNPCEVGKVPWELAGAPHVEFRNLPDRARIRIYTLSGEFVREVEHGPGRYGQSSDAAEWDLKNSSGRDVTSGVYLYRVATAAGGGLPGEAVQGYFTIVR